MEKWVGMASPTNLLTILVIKFPEISESYEVQKRRTTDFEALKL